MSTDKKLKPEFELVQKKYKYSDNILSLPSPPKCFFKLNINDSTIMTLQEYLMSECISCQFIVNITKVENNNEIDEIKALCEECQDDIKKFAYKSRKFKSIPHDFVKLAIFLDKRDKNSEFNIYKEYDKDGKEVLKTVTDNDINIYEQLCKIADDCHDYIETSPEINIKTLKTSKDNILKLDIIKKIVNKPSLDEPSPQISQTEYTVSLFLYIVIFLLIWDSQRNKTLDLVAVAIGYSTYPVTDPNADVEPPFDLTSVCSSVMYICIQTAIFLIVIKFLFQGIKLCTKRMKVDKDDLTKGKERDEKSLYQNYWVDRMEEFKPPEHDEKYTEPTEVIKPEELPKEHTEEQKTQFITNTENYKKYLKAKKVFDKKTEKRKHNQEKLKNMQKICENEETIYNKKNHDTLIDDCFSFPFHMATELLTMILSLLCTEVILWIYAKLIVPRDINMLRMTTVQMHVNIMFFLFLVIYLTLYCYLTYRLRVI